MIQKIQQIPQKVHFVTVTEKSESQRIDNFLLRYLKPIAKSYVYRIIRKGEVRVNKKRVKPEYKLCINDEIRIPPVRLPDKVKVVPADSLISYLSTQIVFENKELLVVNKPSGLAVHGGSGISYGLIEALRKLYGDEQFLELVHRLDRDTSGCILVAKKRSALVHFHEQIRTNRINKTYLALLCGQWKGEKEKVVDLPLIKNTLKSGERIVTVDSQGKKSKSIFKLKQSFNEHTYSEIQIISGRTHQIRVHGQSIGLPVAGDSKYGNFSCNQKLKKLGLKRLFLHSSQLTLKLPGENKNTTFNAHLSDELENFISTKGASL